MELTIAGLPPWALALAFAVTLFAGFVKGAVGFAMPLIMISVFGSFMAPATALAGLILPTLFTNIQQAFRQGPREAWESTRKYRRFIIVMMVVIALSAQIVLALPEAAMLGLLGVPVTAFALVQLAGRELRFRIEHRTRAEFGLGAVAGFYGGISGVWGPPLLVYLLSVGAQKVEIVRVQGVVFLIGAVILVFAHLNSGVLNRETLVFSAALVVPALIGMVIGFRLQDRLDPARFRRWTLILLALSGLNLVRRALIG